MSEPGITDANRPLTPEETQAALFAQLVMQQANLAFMLLGKVPNPQGGELTRDTDSARLLIDQLEMLEAKTRGNLSKDESALLKQTLMTLRLAFVEAVEAAPVPPPAGEPKPGPAETAGTAPAQAQEETHKKFSKKY